MKICRNLPPTCSLWLSGYQAVKKTIRSYFSVVWINSTFFHKFQKLAAKIASWCKRLLAAQRAKQQHCRACLVFCWAALPLFAGLENEAQRIDAKQSSILASNIHNRWFSVFVKWFSKSLFKSIIRIANADIIWNNITSKTSKYFSDNK